MLKKVHISVIVLVCNFKLLKCKYSAKTERKWMKVKIIKQTRDV